MVASLERNARAISSVVNPPISRSVSAARASADSTGWHAAKIRPKQLIAEVVVERRCHVIGARVALILELAADLGMLAREHLGAAELVDGFAFRRRHQPRTRIVGNARLRPLAERGDERVLRQLLREAHVTNHAGEPGDQPRMLDAEHGLDRLVGVSLRHVSGLERGFKNVEKRSRRPPVLQPAIATRRAT